MIQEFLKTVALFRGVADDDLAQVLMFSMVKRYAAGAIILAEGAPGGRLHLIHVGQVRLSKLLPGLGEEALMILGPGDLFGEAEFFDSAPSSTHAIAHCACEVMAIPHKEMEAMLKSRPELAARFHWALGRALAARLRETNQKLGAVLAMSRAG